MTALILRLFCFQVFCGKIPKDIYEDELIPHFEKCGKIWDLRLMMDPMTGLNRYGELTENIEAICLVLGVTPSSHSPTEKRL